MTNPLQNDSGIAPDSIRRAKEIARFVAEQKFLWVRRINYSAVAREVGLTAASVRFIALGTQRNERVMDRLLEEWRRIVAHTRDYEFWRKEENR